LAIFARRCYVEDVAEAVRLAVENPRAAGQVYNVGEADGLDFEGWVQELATVTGWRGRIVVVDEPCRAPNLPRTLNLDQDPEMSTDKIRVYRRSEQSYVYRH
jgi:nucleoside-diphosphate-sugar epimerase